MNQTAKRIIVLLVALAGAGLPVSAFSGPLFAPPLTWGQPLERGSILHGIVVNIDPVNKTLFVKDGTGIVRAIALDEELQIEKRDHPVTLSYVSLGDDVTLSK